MLPLSGASGSVYVTEMLPVVNKVFQAGASSVGGSVRVSITTPGMTAEVTTSDVFVLTYCICT
jgi:hypothetical protein